MNKLGTIIKIKRLPEAATAKNGIYITGPIFSTTGIIRVYYSEVFEEVLVFTDTLKLAKLY